MFRVSIAGSLRRLLFSELKPSHADSGLSQLYELFQAVEKSQKYVIRLADMMDA